MSAVGCNFIISLFSSLQPPPLPSKTPPPPPPKTTRKQASIDSGIVQWVSRWRQQDRVGRKLELVPGDQARLVLNQARWKCDRLKSSLRLPRDICAERGGLHARIIHLFLNKAAHHVPVLGYTFWSISHLYRPVKWKVHLVIMNKLQTWTIGSQEFRNSAAFEMFF